MNNEESLTTLVRGGTNFCCRLMTEVQVPKLDKRGRKTRYTTTEVVPCKHRSPITKPRLIIRHLRRKHGMR